jgi:hypothetical protein
MNIIIAWRPPVRILLVSKPKITHSKKANNGDRTPTINQMGTYCAWADMGYEAKATAVRSDIDLVLILNAA